MAKKLHATVESRLDDLNRVIKKVSENTRSNYLVVLIPVSLEEPVKISENGINLTGKTLLDVNLLLTEKLQSREWRENH